MGFTRKLIGAVRAPGIAWSFSRKGYERRARHFAPGALDVSLAGKRFAVSGANSGIGFAIASALAVRGADVWMLCRNRERGQAAQTKLDAVGDGVVSMEVVDIADMASIDQLLRRVEFDRLDGLIHNAGVLVHEYTESTPGLETTLACHVVGPQRLTRGLLPALKSASDPRVVYVSSGGMYSERLDVASLLTPPEPFDGVRAYARAKRAQVVLAETWAATHPDIRFYAMHPGWSDTVGVERALPSFYRTTRRWLRTPEQGADTAVWLAAARDLPVTSGSFVFDRSEAARYIMPGTRESKEERELLWREIERLASS